MAAHQNEKKNQMNDLQKMVSIIQTGTPVSQEQNSNHLLAVVQAILNSRTLEAIYHTQSRDVVATRLLDPYYLIPRENRFYLIAYCHKKRNSSRFD